jgi:hypothetical protein
MFFLVQEMEKEKQDHKQKMSALMQTHNLEVKTMEQQQKLQIGALMTKAKIGKIYTRIIFLFSSLFSITMTVLRM